MTSEGVQAYLRAVAADERQALCTGPFDVFLDVDSSHPYSNYAIPRDGAEPAEEAVAEVVMVMQRAARVPRLEYLPAIAPAVEDALTGGGFSVELRTPLMTCAAEDLKDFDVPDGVTIQPLGPDAEREQIEGLMRAIALAFDEPYDPSTADSAAQRLTRRTAVVAYADEQIVGGGMCLEDIEGVCELVGIGVTEAARGRGIGAAITGELARQAFAGGVTLAFLTPGSDDTARVYERAGFASTDEMLHMSHPG